MTAIHSHFQLLADRGCGDGLFAWMAVSFYTSMRRLWRDVARTRGAPAGLVATPTCGLALESAMAGFLVAGGFLDALPVFLVLHRARCRVRAGDARVAQVAAREAPRFLAGAAARASSGTWGAAPSRRGARVGCLEILVTDGDERAALAVTRSLAATRCGPGRTSLAGRSRYARAHHRVPDAALDTGAFASALAALCAAHGFDVVVPTTDAACRALIPERKRLGPAVLAAPDLDAYERASHKGEVARLAPRFGLAVPEGGEPRPRLALARLFGGFARRAPVYLVRDGSGLRKRGLSRRRRGVTRGRLA
jgi:hypothetical protein